MLGEDENDEITGLNLKKEFIVPQKFFVPDTDKQQIRISKDAKDKKLKIFDLKNYRFFIPTKYIKDNDKETFWKDKAGNIILFAVGDPMNIDFLDKMTDKSKDLKILCETGMNDLMKAIM